MKDTVDPAHPSIIRLAFTAGVPRRSFIVAVIVGAILNLINQGDVLFDAATPDYLRRALTFIVPYCVATYGVIGARLEALRRNEAPL